MNQINKLKSARPILSKTLAEAKIRVLVLYKAWYRQAPYIIKEYDVPLTTEMVYSKIRQEFLKNKDVKDIRVIDLLVFRGQNELQETAYIWKQRTHIMNYFKEEINKPPSDFLNKFLFGK